MSKKQTKKAIDMRKLPADVKKLLKEEKSAFILDLMVKEWNTREIQTAFETKFNETDRSARNYIKKVKDALAKEGQVDKDKQRALRILQLQMIYKHQIEAKDFKDAASTLSLIMKLEGTEAPKQQQIITHNINTTSNTQFDHMSIEQMRMALLLLKPPTSKDGDSGAEEIK